MMLVDGLLLISFDVSIVIPKDMLQNIKEFQPKCLICLGWD